MRFNWSNNQWTCFNKQPYLKDLPIYISIVFGLTAIVTVFFFYKAANNSKTTLIILLLWLILQAFIGLSGFYTLTEPFPPRLLLLILSPLSIYCCTIFYKKGQVLHWSIRLKRFNSITYNSNTCWVCTPITIYE